MCVLSRNSSRIASSVRVDVVRVARQRDPAERALALAEQRPDVGRHEAREGERVGVAVLGGQRRAGCCRSRTRPRPRACSASIARHVRQRRSRRRGAGSRRGRRAQRVGLLEGQPGRDVAVQRIVRRTSGRSPRRSHAARAPARAAPRRRCRAGRSTARGRSRCAASQPRQRVVEVEPARSSR